MAFTFGSVIRFTARPVVVFHLRSLRVSRPWEKAIYKNITFVESRATQYTQHIVKSLQNVTTEHPAPKILRVSFPVRPFYSKTLGDVMQCGSGVQNG